MSVTVSLFMGAILGLYANLLAACYFRFRDIVADLAHAVYGLDERILLLQLDLNVASRNLLFNEIAQLVRSAFDTACFRLAHESQPSAKHAVNQIMNEILNDIHAELPPGREKVLENHSELTEAEQFEIRVRLLLNKKKVHYVDRITALSPCIGRLLSLESFFR